MTTQESVRSKHGRSFSLTFVSILRIVALCLIVVGSVAAQNAASSTRVTGKVFVTDSQGRSYVAGAAVTISGSIFHKQETDGEGRYGFDVPSPGTYTLEVTFGALQGSSTINVEPGKNLETDIEVKPVEVKTSVTVSDSAPQVDLSAPAQTVTTSMIQNAPNQNDRTESVLPLVPGVVRGPDGRINMKGARNTQSGSLVNSANATDPATGTPGLDVPIDVVAAVQVISNPYDPEYGRLTGAVSTIDTKTSNYEKHHFSIQNILPRTRVREGSVLGIESATPRMTITGPLVKNRIAYTESVEYRFIRTPVNSLPANQRDTQLESVNLYNQIDLNLSQKQTATVSLSVYPQKLKYLGLNTFTPQEATPNYHQRGYQLYAQHRYLVGESGMLVTQMGFKEFDADITSHSEDPYKLFVETAQGGFFNEQKRRSSRFDLEEKYQFPAMKLWGSHQVKVGVNYAYSTYDGEQSFRPVRLYSVDGTPIERITFSDPTSSSLHQHETSWFATDDWNPANRLTLDLGVRADRDTVTSSIHVAPRAGFRLALTKDDKTVLKGGGGVFYDRVPLMIASFATLPNRTVDLLGASGQVIQSTSYLNRIDGDLQNPRSTAWNIAISREVVHGLIVQVGYENRNTARDFVVSPVVGNQATIDVSNRGSQSYREFQVLGRYQFGRHVVNASYVRSRAYGNLNDFFQYFGNVTKAVIPPDEKGRLAYDAPNRVLLWGDFKAPWKLTLMPVYDIHTGFPYSVQNEYREFVGPRNKDRYPRFSSMDLQVLRPFTASLGGKHLRVKAGFSVFNLFNHFNPREVQNIGESPRFGEFFNDAWREYRGKFVFEF